MFHVKLFITGTDTGVGKTFVTAAIARQLVVQGHSVFAWKPIETGCEDDGVSLKGFDAEALAVAAGDWQTDVGRGLYLLKAPLAPLVAAEVEGRTIEIAPIVDMAIRSTSDSVLIEGAGGLRVPITRDIDMAGLANACGFPVLVVARASLGTINHSVLTVEAARGDGLRVAGVVLSRLPNVDSQTAESNRLEIARISRVAVHVFDGSDSAGLLGFLASALATTLV